MSKVPSTKLQQHTEYLIDVVQHHETYDSCVTEMLENPTVTLCLIDIIDIINTV